MEKKGSNTRDLAIGPVTRGFFRLDLEKHILGKVRVNLKTLQDFFLQMPCFDSLPETWKTGAASYQT